MKKEIVDVFSYIPAGTVVDGTLGGGGHSKAILESRPDVQIIGIDQESEYKEEEIPDDLKDHALFIAFAPVEQPEIAVAIIVENGGGGSKTAAPIARKMFDNYFLNKSISKNE